MHKYGPILVFSFFFFFLCFGIKIFKTVLGNLSSFFCFLCKTATTKINHALIIQEWTVLIGFISNPTNLLFLSLGYKYVFCYFFLHFSSFFKSFSADDYYMITNFEWSNTEDKIVGIEQDLAPVSYQILYQFFLNSLYILNSFPFILILIKYGSWFVIFFCIFLIFVWLFVLKNPKTEIDSMLKFTQLFLWICWPYNRLREMCYPGAWWVFTFYLLEILVSARIVVYFSFEKSKKEINFPQKPPSKKRLFTPPPSSDQQKKKKIWTFGMSIIDFLFSKCYNATNKCRCSLCIRNTTTEINLIFIFNPLFWQLPNTEIFHLLNI